MTIIKDYYIDGTDFEIINCPAYETGDCMACNYKVTCRENRDCIIKSHMVALSALVSVAKRTPRSAEHIGAMACFDTFIVEK